MQAHPANWGCAALLVAFLGCASATHTPALALRDRAAAEVHNEQGLAHIREQRPSEAERCFRQAIAADPYCGVAHCNLGICLIQQSKEPFEAAWCFRHASQLMPKAVAPRVGLALIYEKAGQYGTAEEQLRSALKFDPHDIEIVGQLARLHLRQNKFTPETRTWLELVALSDGDPAWRDWAILSLQKKFAPSESAGDTP